MTKFSVKQEDKMGCSVACTAFVLNISYNESLKLFKNPLSAKTNGFYCREIAQVLKKSGLKTEYKYIKTSTIRKFIYNDFSIVFIKRCKRYPAGHYLVRYKNLWMDPWINFPKKPIQSGFRKRLPGKAVYIIRSG